MNDLMVLGCVVFLMLLAEANAQEYSVNLESGSSSLMLTATDTLEGNAIITLHRDGTESRAGIVYPFRGFSDSSRVERSYGHQPRWFVGTKDSIQFGMFYEAKKFDFEDVIYRSLPAILIDSDFNDNGSYGDFNVNIPSGNLSIKGARLESLTHYPMNALRLHGGDFIPQSFLSSYDLGNATLEEHWDNVVAREFVDYTDLILTTSRSLKSNGYGLDQIMQLSPVKSTNLKSKESKIALDPYDVFNYIPEAVHTYDYDGDEGGKRVKKKVANYGMKYNQLIPVLIQAIQDQQEIIISLQADVAQLKEQ